MAGQHQHEGSLNGMSNIGMDKSTNLDFRSSFVAGRFEVCGEVIGLERACRSISVMPNDEAVARTVPEEVLSIAFADMMAMCEEARGSSETRSRLHSISKLSAISAYLGTGCPAAATPEEPPNFIFGLFSRLPHSHKSCMELSRSSSALNLYLL